MTTTGACRYFRKDDVPDALLFDVFDMARFAPSGGNRQPVRFVLVRDPQVRKRLRDLYLIPWQRYMDGVRAGTVGTDVKPGVVEDADQFARHLHEVPVLAVICVRFAGLLVTDAKLDRPSFVGGASVYPFVQNLLLACRERGLGATMTSLLAEFEPEIKTMLGLPEEFAVGGTVAIGWPARNPPTRLRRRAVEELVFVERFGQPLTRGVSRG